MKAKIHLLRLLITRPDFRRAYIGDVWYTLVSPEYRALKAQINADLVRRMQLRLEDTILHGIDVL